MCVTIELSSTLNFVWKLMCVFYIVTVVVEAIFHWLVKTDQIITNSLHDKMLFSNTSHSIHLVKTWRKKVAKNQGPLHDHVSLNDGNHKVSCLASPCSKFVAYHCWPPFSISTPTESSSPLSPACSEVAYLKNNSKLQPLHYTNQLGLKFMWLLHLWTHWLLQSRCP